MALTQMNVRIDADLKTVGDHVFEQIGLTPTQVVRRVWEYAAAHRDSPAVVRNAFTGPVERSDNLDREMRALMIAADANRVAEFRERVAPNTPVVPVELDYKQLREEAFLEARAAGEWRLR
jgi:RHH-type rel operon transcriptional repressor/antitoxin RelB